MRSRPASGSLHVVAIAAVLMSALLTVTSNAASPADQRAAALDKAIPLAMQRASIPGAIVGIWQDGSEPYVRAFGVRDLVTREKMATDLYMRIGSTSKTFAVTAILMLADEFPSPHAHGYLRLPDGKIVDATDWNPSWGWAAGNMISTLDDLRVWTRDLAIGKLLSPAMKQSATGSCRRPRKATARFTA